LVEPIEAAIKNCKLERAELKKTKKNYKLKLDKIEGDKENTEAKILNGQEKLKHIGQQLNKAVKKQGKLNGRVGTLQNN